jgi:hypothetical protein
MPTFFFMFSSKNVPKNCMHFSKNHEEFSKEHEEKNFKQENDRQEFIPEHQHFAELLPA